MKELTLYQEDDGTWVASSSRLPGYVAKAKTPEEAIDRFKKAFSMYFPCGECKGGSER